MNLVLERIPCSAAANKSASQEALSAPPVSRVHLSAVLHSRHDEAARERIRRLFHSPLGVYVSQASRDHDDLRLVFDVAAEDLDFTVRTLHQVLPEAVIEAVRPRVFTHRREH
ncbi:hypothetical protein AWB69_07847 [Caballeronia udeis]|uniref:Uncharacterized protein n=1 Tax=Caballeronia udeis TaxID=1232866 RepID=A0A158JHC4_9BURK|nr:hypothetical protein [Caballeronia udeis]SAL67740.1 hypothetical protein AWB69_07847 [Caballeronia udeis]